MTLLARNEFPSVDPEKYLNLNDDNSAKMDGQLMFIFYNSFTSIIYFCTEIHLEEDPAAGNHKIPEFFEQECSQDTERKAHEESAGCFLVRDQISTFQSNDTTAASLSLNSTLDQNSESASNDQAVRTNDQEAEPRRSQPSNTNATTSLPKLRNWEIAISLLKNKAPGIKWHGHPRTVMFKILDKDVFAKEYSKYKAEPMEYKNIARGFR